MPARGRNLEELQLTLTPSRVDQRNQGIMLANWRIGQTINALVSDRMPSGNLLLTVGGHSFVTTRDIPVQPGGRVMLEVQQLEPKLVLRLLSTTPSSSNQVGNSAVMSGGLLDVRESSGQGFERLIVTLARSLSSSSGQSHLNFQEWIRLLSQNFLNSNNVSADGVRASFLLSGIFTETLWYSNRSAQAARSTKTSLLTIRSNIASAMQQKGLTAEERSALSRLLANIDELIGSVTRHQISSISQDPTSPKWVTSLPLQFGEKVIEVEVEIEKRGRQKGDNSAEWSVILSLTLEGLGSITFLIEMQNSRLRINVRVNESSSEALNASLPMLRSRLIASGLEVDDLSCTISERKLHDANETAKASLNISV